MREQHDDEPREASTSSTYRPFMPGQDQPNRAQRRHMAQARKRGRRRMERATIRATIRAMREVTAEERRRPQLSADMADAEDDTTTVTIDLETGDVR